MTNGVFSDFEIDQMSVKFANAAQAVAMNCVGSVEEEMTSKIISKNCRGVKIKNVVKGTGEGTLTISAHVPYAIYKEAFGMEHNDLIAGVKAYGQNSVHKEFCLTLHVKDEDGEEKYKAYPRCVCNARPAVSVENGAEEVAEIEMEIAVMPDTFGYGMYEALATEIDSAKAAQWINSFTPALVQGSATYYNITRTLTRCSTSNTDTQIQSGNDYFARFTAESGYTLPNTITVKYGSTTKAAGTDYIWNPTNGTLYAINVSGNLAITVTATATA